VLRARRPCWLRKTAEPVVSREQSPKPSGSSRSQQRQTRPEGYRRFRPGTRRPLLRSSQCRPAQGGSGRSPASSLSPERLPLDYWGETEYDPQEAQRPSAKDPAKRSVSGPLTLAVAAEKGGIDDPRVKGAKPPAWFSSATPVLFPTKVCARRKAAWILRSTRLNWLLNREQLAGFLQNPNSPFA